MERSTINRCLHGSIKQERNSALKVNEGEILSLFEEWNDALQTGDPLKVTALYDCNAIILPTLSNQVRHNPEEFADYFEKVFLPREPEGRINEANVRIFEQLAINSGICTFTFNDGSSVRARFSFVYCWNGVRWMIIEHHSSLMPE